MSEMPWLIVRPGVIMLPNTKYTIEYDGMHELIIKWDGKRVCHHVASNVWNAKNAVQEHMRELVMMGIDP